MATYYIDPNLGSDVTGDGTEGNPFASCYGGAAASAYGVGHSWLIKRGTTHGPIDAAFTGNPTGEAQRVIYGAYGPDGNAPPVINASASAYGVRVQNKDYVTVQDLDIHDATNTGLQVLSNSTRACNHFKAYRVRAYRAGYDGIGYSNSANSPSAATGVLLEDCEGHDCGQHGVAISAYVNEAIIRRAKASNNSLSSSGWGVYQSGHGITYIGTSGWSISGNVKYRSIATEPYSVISGNTVAGRYHLTKNTSTPTTPGTGEWGWSSGTLYVNIGVIASGYSIAIIYQPNTNAVIEDSEGWGHTNSTYDMVGIGLDRGVYGGVIRRCKGWDNGGSAIQVNQAQNVLVFGCIGHNNRETVYMSTMGGTKNIVVNCTGDETDHGVRVERLYTGDEIKIYNNIVVATNAIYAATISGTVTNDYNCVRGGLSGVSAGANDVTDDPFLSSDYKPQSGSPCLGAGVYALPGATDFRGLAFRHPDPTIGAFEMRTKVLVKSY